MFGAAKKVCPPRVVEHEVPFHTGSGDVDEMLADIQQKLDALHALNEACPTRSFRRHDPDGKAGRSIVETVEASPAKAKQVRRFANYYLPDAVNVLEQYAKLARQACGAKMPLRSGQRWSGTRLPSPLHSKTSWMHCMPLKAWTSRRI